MPILVNGSTVALAHLATIVRTMDLDLTAGLKKNKARLEFRFSCHCYSRGPTEGEEIPKGMLVPDGSTHMPRNRIFSQERYELSLGLVDKIDNLISTNGLVEYSRSLNFFSTSIVSVNNNGQPQPVNYYIFMDATKKQEPNHPKKLDIFVESAYPDSPNIPSPVAKGNPRPLSEVLGAVWENK